MKENPSESWREELDKYWLAKVAENDKQSGMKNTTGWFDGDREWIKSFITRTIASARKDERDRVLAVCKEMKSDYLKDVLREKNRPYDWHGYAHGLSDLAAKISSL